jgi:hypothetical protein
VWIIGCSCPVAETLALLTPNNKVDARRYGHVERYNIINIRVIPNCSGQDAVIYLLITAYYPTHRHKPHSSRVYGFYQTRGPPLPHAYKNLNIHGTQGMCETMNRTFKQARREAELRFYELSKGSHVLYESETSLKKNMTY